MKGITPTGGIVGHNQLPGFTGVIPTGGCIGWGHIMGWADSMTFDGIIIHI